MQIGDKVVCIKDMYTAKVGDTGVYTFGADYVPGWDAGQFTVTLDNPRTNHRCSNHWTYQELSDYWKKVE